MDKEMRLTPVELELLKTTFAENDSLLKLLRKPMFQASLTLGELEQIKSTFTNEELRKLMRKMFLPELSFEAPLGQQVDLWVTVNLKENEGWVVETVEARAKLIEMLELGLKSLETGIVGGFDIVNFKPETKDASENDLFTQMTIRNSYIMHIESVLLQIKMLAGIKNETVEQTINKLKKDSTK